MTGLIGVWILIRFLNIFCLSNQNIYINAFFKERMSPSFFIIRRMFQESKSFYLPFKHECHISICLGGSLELETEVHKMHFQEKNCYVIEQACSYLDPILLSQLFQTERSTGATYCGLCLYYSVFFQSPFARGVAKGGHNLQTIVLL